MATKLTTNINGHDCKLFSKCFKYIVIRILYKILTRNLELRAYNFQHSKYRLKILTKCILIYDDYEKNKSTNSYPKLYLYNLAVILRIKISREERRGHTGQLTGSRVKFQ